MNIVNPDNTDFRDDLAFPIYVDKTGLLKYTNSVVNSPARFLCVSRPRRFGKTMAAKMLSAYYGCGCDSNELFQNLEIASSPDYKTHLNKYNVVRIDMIEMGMQLEEGRSDANRSKIYKKMSLVNYVKQRIVEELKELFPGMSNWGVSLGRIFQEIYRNSKEKQRFVFIIDEWDYLFRKPDPVTPTDKYINFLTDLFKGMGNQYHIALVYLTGIYPIKKYGIQSQLNQFGEFSMVEPFILAEYYGFTDAEVKVLCDKFGADYEELREWYDGYHFRGGISIYNPMSVVNAISYRYATSYWTNTEAYESLKNYINLDKAGLQQIIALLMRGFSVSVKTGSFSSNIGEPTTRDEVLTMLVHLGYLRCKTNPGSDSLLSIPNKEIQREFEESTITPDWNNLFHSLRQSQSLLKATWAGNASKVAEQVDAMHLKYTSVFDYNDENSLSCVLMMAYYTAGNEYQIVKEENTGRGRADLFFRPKKDSTAIPMVVELKRDETSDSALQQIKDKKYYTKLSDYPKILLVGINYNADTDRHTCTIEVWKNS